MKTFLEITLFVAVTLGPATVLWLRVERQKRRNSGYLQRSSSSEGAFFPGGPAPDLSDNHHGHTGHESGGISGSGHGGGFDSGAGGGHAGGH